MCLTTLTKQELEDILSEAKADYQAALRRDDRVAMREHASTMNACYLELSTSKGM